MSHATRSAEPTARELTVQLAEELSRLVRDEIALARAELSASVRRAKGGGILLAVAAVVGLAGGAVLVATAVAGIAVALPVWLAALIVGGGLSLIAAVCGLLAVRSLRNGIPPFRITTNSIHRELRELTSAARRQR